MSLANFFNDVKNINDFDSFLNILQVLSNLG